MQNIYKSLVLNTCYTDISPLIKFAYLDHWWEPSIVFQLREKIGELVFLMWKMLSSPWIKDEPEMFSASICMFSF